MAVTLAACGGGGSTAPAKVAAVDLTPAGQTKNVGETLQMTATPRDASGNALSGRTVAWLSSNAAVATVSTTGLVTCLTAGTASISAAIEGMSASVAITVAPPPVASVTLTPAAVSVPTGTTSQLTVTPKSADGTALTGRTASWQSATAAVATVSLSGLVTGVTPGTSLITATIEGKSATSLVTVTLNPCSLAAAVTMSVGQTMNGTLAATDCAFLDNGVPDGTYFDIYIFDVTTTSTIQIDLVSTAFDAYLFFYQYDGTTQKFLYQSQDDNSGGGTNSRISALMTPGTYMVFANSNPPTAFGDYALTIKVAGSAIVADNSFAAPTTTPTLRRLGRFNSVQLAQLQQQLKRAPH